jgi:hypothetical protein
MTTPEGRIELYLTEGDLCRIVEIIDEYGGDLHFGQLSRICGYVDIPDDPAEDAAYIEDRVRGTSFCARDISDCIAEVREVRGLANFLREAIPKHDESCDLDEDCTCTPTGEIS